MAHEKATFRRDVNIAFADVFFQRVDNLFCSTVGAGSFIRAETLDDNHERCPAAWRCFRFRHDGNCMSRQWPKGGKLPDVCINQGTALICQFADHPIGLDRIDEPRLDPSVIETTRYRAGTNFLAFVVKKRQFATRLRKATHHPALLVTSWLMVAHHLRRWSHGNGVRIVILWCCTHVFLPPTSRWRLGS